jgi:hypothetical protein
MGAYEFGGEGPAGDSAAPLVSITNPLAGAIVAGVVTVAAGASDNVGVMGVQFQLNGANLGSEDTTNSYSMSWDTKQVANGLHVIGAVARDAAGNTGSSALTVTVNNASQPTLTLTANPTNIQSGNSSALSWSSGNATSCTASGAWSGSKSLSGQQSVSPAGNASYTLTCTGAGGSVTRTVSIVVTVNNPVSQPTLTLTANPASIEAGKSSTLSWSSSNATSCTASGAWSGSKSLSGQQSVSPASNKNYTLTCTGAGGSVTRTASVAVTAPSSTGEMSFTFKASASTITLGQSVTLSWTSSNTTGCSAGAGWSGTKPLSGKETVKPAVKTTYSLRCWGGGQDITRSLTVRVN